MSDTLLFGVDIEPAAIEAECADEVVEPPWSASGSLMMSCRHHVGISALITSFGE